MLKDAIYVKSRKIKRTRIMLICMQYLESKYFLSRSGRCKKGEWWHKRKTQHQEDNCKGIRSHASIIQHRAKKDNMHRKELEEEVLRRDYSD